MEKAFLIGIILVLIVALAYVSSFAYRARTDDTGFTELSFVQGEMLPETLSPGTTYRFSFTIANTGDRTEQYRYEVIAGGETIDKGVTTVASDGEGIVEVSYSPTKAGEVQVAVTLPALQQQIQQWVTVS